MTEKEKLEDLLTMHCFLKERGLAIAEQAEKDIPVIDNAWGRRKEYKYNSYT